MKYYIGQELEYTGDKDFILKVVNIKNEDIPIYECKVIEGPWAVGKIWDKRERYLDKSYKPISSYYKQKNKLKV